MTTKADYTTEEWNLILQAPVLVGLFIIQADVYSLPVTYMKMLAAFRAIIETAEHGATTGLIKAVIDAVRAGQRPEALFGPPSNLREARLLVLDRCRQVAALLAHKVPSGEAKDYNHWLLAIGLKVALVSGKSWMPAYSFQPDARAYIALETLAAILEGA